MGCAAGRPRRLRVACRAGGEGAGQLTFTWAMQAASGLTSLADFAAAPGSPYLYIPGGQLASQASYTFTCSVASSDSSLGPGQVHAMAAHVLDWG